MNSELEDIVFFDLEVGENGRINDIGAVRRNINFHSKSKEEFFRFIDDAKYVCGHNIIRHDLKYLPLQDNGLKIIDTLFLSPLLFPCHPYHKLLKDEKLLTDELNNPLSDSLKCRELFFDEINAFNALSTNIKEIYSYLLSDRDEFKGFFDYLGIGNIREKRKFFIFGNSNNENARIEQLIKREFAPYICNHSFITPYIKNKPVELCYALSLSATSDYHSITPAWVEHNYPEVDNIIKKLMFTPCSENCEYCRNKLDAKKRLKDFFGYDSFRLYDGENLQEKAVNAALNRKSLLAIFPTGGGKSLTFQLPALISGQMERGLSIVISPLQSLMKDQVDNLNSRGIADAVSVNGAMNKIERAESIRRVESGLATILYISPEQLRSKTIWKILLSRKVVRFIIDEAHCFSSWGQDFRVDYLYIGEFIKDYQKKKGLKESIPISCFTATAKQKVVSDICQYFNEKLNLKLEMFTSNATRQNLRYVVLYKNSEEEKYLTLRQLISSHDCSTIVYVSRTQKTIDLSERLTKDGFESRPFNGKMDVDEKLKNQDDFMQSNVKIIVATSAFGMGVDKKDVKLVVHYDISDSLENYIQEAGRAGRDENISAECYVLYNENDLDKHFLLLNQTKLSMSEISQVWKAIKDLCGKRNICHSSALEIARRAGWDEKKSDIETRIRTAINALEVSGYVKRGKNSPRIFATSIMARNMAEAAEKIDKVVDFTEKERRNAKRIIKSLISARSISKSGNQDGEYRVDYISDVLGIDKTEVLEAINKMKLYGILSDSDDMSAYIFAGDSINKSEQNLNRFLKLERFIISNLKENGCVFSLKELNENASGEKIPYSSIKNIKTIIFFLTIKGYISKGERVQEGDKGQYYIYLAPKMSISQIQKKLESRSSICHFIVNYLYQKAADKNISKELLVEFSIVELYKNYNNQNGLIKDNTTIQDIEDALLYLSKIGSLRLEGGFLVLYNALEVKRVVLDNKIKYKKEDYRALDEYYKQKIQQIHIVGEYANLMVKDYNAALQFVSDYFQMDYKRFIKKYFDGDRQNQISINITQKKYEQLFGKLSEIQKSIINDKENKYITVFAGPGSGKTMVLVHKLASLLLLEDIKYEQLLMLTFSRVAATEFKKRLRELIGNAVKFVDIKTFHSYCFDIIGRQGDLDKCENVVRECIDMIKTSEVEQEIITKSVLVIDEAQDMDDDEAELVRILVENNDNMRVIAVGDDDQNIYEFRGSNSNHMKDLMNNENAKSFNMLTNYRSKSNIVSFSNKFVRKITNRLKNDDIIPFQKDEGVVKVFHYKFSDMQYAVADNILNSYKGGSCCVLTQTNEEAMQMLNILLKHNKRAKLIQSNDGFDLFDLVEIRFFIKNLKLDDNPIIDIDRWNSAKNALKTKYATSQCLEIVLNMIEDFENVNPDKKFKNDWLDYINESKIEDLYKNEKDCIYISTIHKSKGREFDSVYILLNENKKWQDEELRAIYVALTRARNNLFVHTNSHIFDNCRVIGVEHIDNLNTYPSCSEIIFPLTHRDVFLSFFKGKNKIIFALRSGDSLYYEDDCLYTDIFGSKEIVCKLSKSCIAKLSIYFSKGYIVKKSIVRFIVAYESKEDNALFPIILPTIYLEKV